MDTSVVANQNECGVCFSSVHPTKVPARIIRLCFVTCDGEVVGHGILLWMTMQQLAAFLR